MLLKTLVIGGGGREHAIAWQLSKSPSVKEVWVWPGNPGMRDVARIADPAPYGVHSADDVAQLAEFAAAEKFDLTVVGPEAFLAAGAVDAFSERGLKVVGPTQKAAAIESSKVFAKQLMRRAGVPTADFIVAATVAEAKAAVDEMGVPVVVKAEGLAAGKGVVVAQSVEEAYEAIDMMMADKIFGSAGERLVIESFLEGEEATVLAFTDGKHFVTMPASQDHKTIGEGDTGPNTGGMGAYAPAPVITPSIMEDIERTIIAPVIKQMADEGRPFQGVLYAGLMMTDEGPVVVEFNGRLGDPEAQVVLPLLETDIVPAFLATIEGGIEDVPLRWSDEAAVCVVVASKGYPGHFEAGKPITFLEETAADDANTDHIRIFHSGTGVDEDDRLVTKGGRVLGVTAVGPSISRAIADAYKGVQRVQFDGMVYRRDIGARALAHRDKHDMA